MIALDTLLTANRSHAASFRPLSDGRPQARLAMVTCMDVRIDPLQIFGLGLGEAHVLRNAGARFTPDVERGLVISSKLYGTDTVVVVQHTKCGLLTSDEDLQSSTGAPLAFLSISSHDEALRHDLEAIANSAYLGSIRQVFGLLYDLTDATVVERCRIER